MSVDTVTFTNEEIGADAPEQPQEQQERPEGLPEKFNSVEDMAQSYQELEQKLGGDSSEDSTEESTQQEATDQVVEAIGADTFEKYSTEYFENENKLSEDSYKELQEKYNFSPELVDSFIRGQEAMAQAELSEVHSVVGGAEKYNEVIGWAQANLAESEIDTYNDTVNNGSTASIKMALQGMYARYASENGVDPTLVKGGGRARAAGYESKQQMVNDMMSPKYQSDPAYRKEVERRLANTPSSVI